MRERDGCVECPAGWNSIFLSLGGVLLQEGYVLYKEERAASAQSGPAVDASALLMFTRRSAIQRIAITFFVTLSTVGDFHAEGPAAVKLLLGWTQVRWSALRTAPPSLSHYYYCCMLYKYPVCYPIETVPCVPARIPRALLPVGLHLLHSIPCYVAVQVSGGFSMDFYATKCALQWTFYDRLIASMLAPLFLIFLSFLYTLARGRWKKEAEWLDVEYLEGCTVMILYLMFPSSIKSLLQGARTARCCGMA